jgi:soluble lytic murein transglycosylase-like protein
MLNQTAASRQEQGSGCLSGFILPPLAVILFSSAFAYFVMRQPLPNNAVLPPVVTNAVSHIFSPEVRYWQGSILKWAAEWQLDPNLIATVIQIESCGDPLALSSAGAMGLFQVMPFHFYAAEDPYNPNINASRGLAYLSRSLEAAGGEVRLALAGYNGGLGIISRPDWLWPDQTKRYVQYGAPIYEDAHRGVDSSDMLNEWFVNYGVSLCQQAHQSLHLP